MNAADKLLYSRQWQVPFARCSLRGLADMIAGEGHATIAGGGGTMWTTALQIGELIDTAQRVS